MADMEKDPYLQPDDASFKANKAKKDLVARKKSNAQRYDNALKEGNYEEQRAALDSAREIEESEKEQANPNEYAKQKARKLRGIKPN